MVQSCPSPTHSPHSSTRAEYSQDMPWHKSGDQILRQGALPTWITSHRGLGERVNRHRLVISKSWQDDHPWKMLPQLSRCSSHHLHKISQDPITQAIIPFERRKGQVQPPHCHAWTASRCHGGASLRSSRSGQSSGAQRCACTLPQLCAGGCHTFCSLPTLKRNVYEKNLLVLANRKMLEYVLQNTFLRAQLDNHLPAFWLSE